MELLNQKTKAIMEGCKQRAREAGLCFGEETLEYIVSNRDLLELTPKYMIPTLYDYWVHDVEVLKEKGRYELYPHNPYETVINTRPAISFYNDNNPDWLNVMIFYHVLGHIDFFQRNVYFRNTWDYDFTGQALSDKRLINKLRSEKGRWVDYVIEFARGIDNLVGFHHELSQSDRAGTGAVSASLDFYFDVFLQTIRKVSTSDYVKEINRYNECRASFGDAAEQSFFAQVRAKYPEFDSLFERHHKQPQGGCSDVLQFLLQHSEFLNRDENRWMKSIIEVVRKTSLFFQPQIRTKIMNEGWASYWHEKLFLRDDRIVGHEVDFARVHSAVTAMPRVGLNPYALGMRLFSFVEEQADKGRLSFDYVRLQDSALRKDFDSGAASGQEYISQVRTTLSDGLFIDRYIDQDFMERHNLFVAGRRLNRQRMVWEYYVKSRKAEEYRAMVHNSLYHPPWVSIDADKNKNNTLYLVHHFEGKPLVADFIDNTMMGLEFLWGGPVQLETSDAVVVADNRALAPGVVPGEGAEEEPALSWRRVVYTMKDKKLSKKQL
jgi:stage V sporulation protein R